MGSLGKVLVGSRGNHVGVKLRLKKIVNKLLLQNYENAHDTVTQFEKSKMFLIIGCWSFLKIY